MTLINFLTDGIRARDLQQYHADNNRGIVTLSDRDAYNLEHGRQLAEIIKTVAQRIHNVAGKAAMVDDPALDDQPLVGGSPLEDADDDRMQPSALPRVGLRYQIEQDPYRRTFEETGWYLVDQVVLVEGLTPQQRSVNEEFWAFNRNIMILTGCLAIVGSVAGLVVSAAAASTVLVLAASVIAFVSPFFAALCFYRAYQAHDQMQQWGVSPAVTVANQRAAAYREGFFYAVDHNLRADPKNPSPDGVLAADEVKYLYREVLGNLHRAFEAAQDFSLPGQRAVLDDFVQRSPLSQEAILFICPPDTAFADAPEHFRKSNAAYELFCANYAGLSAYVGQKKREVAARHSEVLAELNVQKEAHLKPYKEKLESQRASVDGHFQPMLHNMRIERQEYGAVVSSQPDQSLASGSEQHASPYPYSLPPQPSDDLLTGPYGGHASPYDGGMSFPQQSRGASMRRDADDADQIHDPIERAQSEWDQALAELTQQYTAETARIEEWHAGEVQRLHHWKDEVIDRMEGKDERGYGYLNAYLRIAGEIVDNAQSKIGGYRQDSEDRAVDYDVIEIDRFRIDAFSAW